MSEVLRRVSVHTSDHRGETTVDLTLPSHATLAMLIPVIVDIMREHGCTAPTGAIRGWQLSRLGGEPLDESTTLSQNDIHDGDVLVLSTVDDVPRALAVDDRPAPVVAATTSPRDRLSPVVGSAICLWAATVGIVSLGWAGVRGSGLAEVSAAALLTLVFGAVAVAGRRTHADRVRCVTLCVVAIGCAATAGFLAVPGQSNAPAYLLAAATAASTAVVLMRLTGFGEVVLTSLATCSSVSAIAVACTVLWRLPIPSVGAVLAAVSLGGLTLASRISVGLAGLAPRWPSSEDTYFADNTYGPEELAGRAEYGHRTLTGLVLGTAGSAALGMVLIAMGNIDAGADGPSGAVFGAVVGMALWLRARSYAGDGRRIALVAGGIACFTTAFALTAMAVPDYAGWFGVAAVGSGVAVLYPVAGSVRNPVAHRAVDVLEYLSLAAVVPLACWVAGIYGMIRGLSLV